MMFDHKITICPTRLCSVLFIALFISSTAYSQVNLDQIANLSNLMPNQNTLVEDDVTDQENDMIDLDDVEDEPDMIDQDDTEKYGYQGRIDSFNSYPVPKTRDELTLFGYEFFSKIPSTFATSKNTSVPENYIIGSGDVIRISLFGNKNARYDLRVSNDGDILIPEIGPISASGLTLDLFRELIDKTVSNKYIGTTGIVSLTNLRSISIFVLGDAVRPGMYTLSSLTTLTNAIFTSGGIRSTGSLRDIQLKRDGQLVSSIDLYDLLLNGDTSSDVKLQEGDVVFIPPRGKTVAITGEVMRPHIFELINDETFQNLLEYSGGYKPSADPKSLEIDRVDRARNSYKLVKVSSNQGNPSLENGDVFRVYPIAPSMSNAILIKGHAKQPGFMPWKSRMKFSDIVRDLESLLPMTDTNYVLVKSKSSDGFSFQDINLEKMFIEINQKGASTENIEINEKDEIIFFPKLLSLDLITEQEGEYKVFQYCTILPSLGENLIKFRGNSTFASLSSSETENRVDNITQIRQAQSLSYSANQSEEISLTHVCRQQLIKPLLDILSRQTKLGESKESISVFGNVFFPGDYPVSKNMTIEDALNAAGGLKDASYTSQIEHIKRVKQEKEFRYLASDSSIDDISKSKIRLNPADQVNVKKISKNIQTVSISGEVYFPGEYPMLDGETLSDIVRRAGGIKPSAFPDGAVFIRSSMRQKEIRALNTAQTDLKKKIILSQQSKETGTEMLSPDLISELYQLTDDDGSDDLLGRYVIDLDGILNGSDEDITLEDQDSLLIPKKQNSVLVIGEVILPKTLPFTEKSNYQDYLALTGGVTEYADAKSAYIIKSNGSIVPISSPRAGGFFRSGLDKSGNIQPGDTIVVPIKIENFDTLRATTEITQIVYQLSVAAAAVSSF